MRGPLNMPVLGLEPRQALDELRGGRFVDLWTAESGCIDLIIDARVYETNGDYRIEARSVDVP